MNDKAVERLAAWALVALSLSLSACGKASNDADSPSSDAPGSSAGANGVVAVGGRGSVPNASAGTAGTDIGDPCVPGIPPTSQIPRLLDQQYDTVLRDLLGVTAVASADGHKPSQLLADDAGDPGAAMTAPAWQLYQDAGAKIAHEVLTGPNKSKFISCDPSAAGCLDQTIKSFGRKAFRRPLTDAEVARFQKLGQATPAPTPDELAETTLFAFLVSPSFLFLPELQSATDPSLAVSLSSYEVATRLSMLIWGSIPDDVLNAAADANQLVTQDQVRAQATRMVALRDKSEPIVSAFHRRWLRVDDPSGHWFKNQHDLAQYPLYSDAAKAAEQGELDAFAAEIAFSGGSFQDLWLSNAAFVNQATAPIYGLDPAAYGSDLKRVELDATQRPGLLTRVGFLSSYANYAQTSPPLRGAFIARELLGIPIGAPSPGDVAISVINDDFTTQRDYFTALTSATHCQTCHSVFNPFGFALENFDAIGQWQTVDRRGGPIDATATIDFGDGVKPSIDSPLELAQQIAASPKAQQLYAQSWVSFAFSRPPNSSDECLVDGLAAKIAAGSYALLDVLPKLVQAPSFRGRVRATP